MVTKYQAHRDVAFLLSIANVVSEDVHVYEASARIHDYLDQSQPVPELPAWALRNGYGWDQIASGEAAHIAAPLLADIGKKVLAAAPKPGGES